MRKTFGLLAALAVLALATGCPAPKKDKEKAEKAKPKDDEPEEGPHKGVITEWGDHEYHVELVVDHGKKEARVYIYGPSHKLKPAPIPAETVKLSIKSPPLQMELKPEKQPGDPEGKYTCYVGTNDALAKEQEYEGSISAKFNGKPYAGDFSEKPHHHDKK